jgi:hypothetical protein
MGCVTSKQVEDDRIVEPDLRPANGKSLYVDVDPHVSLQRAGRLTCRFL